MNIKNSEYDSKLREKELTIVDLQMKIEQINSKSGLIIESLKERIEKFESDKK